MRPILVSIVMMLCIFFGLKYFVDQIYAKINGLYEITNQVKELDTQVKDIINDYNNYKQKMEKQINEYQEAIKRLKTTPNQCLKDFGICK